MKRTKLSLILAVSITLWLQPGHALARNANELTQLRSKPVETFNANDGYPTPAGERRVHRMAGTIVMEFDPNQAKDLAATVQKHPVLAGYEFQADVGGRLAHLSAKEGKRASNRADRQLEAAALNAARRLPGVIAADPVFIDPESQLLLFSGGEVIVCLVDPKAAPAILGALWNSTRKLAGTTDQFIVKAVGETAEQMLARARAYAGTAGVRWAEPNWNMEIQPTSTPNDTLFGYQWELNVGSTGSPWGGSIRANPAWDVTTGTGKIIAILDCGVQLDHPDLRIWTNPGETAANSTDDDGNGWVDDVHGWDFKSSSNDPSPKSIYENHGTACAGVAAAYGNNSLGVAGAAYGATIMPLRVADTTSSGTGTVGDVAGAIRYAGGSKASGVGTWSSADILSISGGFTSSTAIDDALHWTATSGRGGKGCAIFCATGNSASGYQLIAVNVTAGTHALRWSYTKDASGTAGEDAVWIDDVYFGGTLGETFEGLLPGWTTSSTPWGIDIGQAHLRGTGYRAIRSGAIGNSANTWLQVSVTFGGASTVYFYAWVSSQATNDKFEFLVDGVAQPMYVNGSGTSVSSLSGVPATTSGISYPASHTDTIAVGAVSSWGLRSDYSQYSSKVDFVAPGGMASSPSEIWGKEGVTTTDRTGSSGYVSGDYVGGFNGTSAATPSAAGVAALVLGVNSTLTASQVRTWMRDNCVQFGSAAYSSGRNDYYGYGKVDALKSVAQGRLDSGFGGSSGPNGIVSSAVFDGDKVVIAGSFSTVGGVSKPYLARLNSDGTLDTGFSPGALNDVATVVVKQQVGASTYYLVAGEFSTAGGVAHNGIVRYNSSGSVDTTFTTQANDFVRAIKVQSDGKILIGGYFTSVGGSSRNRLARLNSDGSVDTGFNISVDNNAVMAIDTDSSGNIFIGGFFTSVASTTRNNIAEINSSGSLMTGFNPGTGASGGSIYSLATQADGKVVIAGSFTGFNSVTRAYVARLTTAGAVDTTFGTTTGGPNNLVYQVKVAPSQRIILAGAYTTVNGTSQGRFSVLAPDGTLAPYLYGGSGANGGVNCVAADDFFRGQLFVGGNFTQFHSTSRANVARIYLE